MYVMHSERCGTRIQWNITYLAKKKEWNNAICSNIEGLSRRLSGKESTCQCRKCRRLRFNHWLGKIPWRKRWQATPVFLPGEFHGQRSLVGTVHGVTKSQTQLRDWTTKTTSEAFGKCFHICYFFNEGYISVFLSLILFPFFGGIASQ